MLTVVMALAFAVEEPEEVFIFADGFSRWDDTRWHVTLQLGFPMPQQMMARRNGSVRLQAAEIEAVFHCNKRWRRGKKRFEVDCRIDDIALRGVPVLNRTEATDAVLEEMDTYLTGSVLRLLVNKDGRVGGVGLEIGKLDGSGDDRDYEERLRRLMFHAVAGFHMKLPRSVSTSRGQWVEYDTALFELPGARPSGSGHYVVHQLDRYKGQLVVQSVGEATMAMAPARDLSGLQDGLGGDPAALGLYGGAPNQIGLTRLSADTWENFYKGTFDGVATYDPLSGHMTERVWSMTAKATAGSAIAEGWSTSRYFQFGRLRQIEEDTEVDVGESERVLAPSEPDRDEISRWQVFE